MPASLTIRPAVALIDVPREFSLDDFEPDSEVTLSVTSRHADGRFWRSVNTYRADAGGAVRIATQAPLAGSYEGIDGLGPIWSQSVIVPVDSDANTHPVPTPAGALIEYVRAQDGAGNVAEATFEQHFAAPGVSRRELKENGLVGVLYSPSGPGPYPAIIVLNGSDGGINERRAALFASHGYHALALGYFGAPGLPAYLSGIELEYFERAARWLRGAVAPEHDFLAVSGHSRGGELSLLLSSLYPDTFSAVVALVPSSVVHSVLNAGKPGEDRFQPAWTLNGQPVTHVWEINPAQDWSAVDSQIEPRRQAVAFVQAQRDAAAVARARIPVEKIAGPVLLLSAGDDGYWPSTDYAREVAQALAAARHPYPVVHLDYPAAGHAIQAPYVPTTEIASPHVVSGIVLTGGGTPQANTRANTESWAATLAFLHAAVQARIKEVR